MGQEGGKESPKFFVVGFQLCGLAKPQQVSNHKGSHLAKDVKIWFFLISLIWRVWMIGSPQS